VLSYAVLAVYYISCNTTKKDQSQGGKFFPEAGVVRPVQGGRRLRLGSVAVNGSRSPQPPAWQKDKEPRGKKALRQT
jgi:hypothetical protein